MGFDSLRYRDSMPAAPTPIIALIVTHKVSMALNSTTKASVSKKMTRLFQFWQSVTMVKI